MERTVTIPTAAIGNAVAAYTVGFVKLEIHDKVEDAIGAGSGTLVRVGKVHGILTAAHVLAHLPDSGAVGIVEYRGETMHYRKRQIEMADTVKVALRGDAFGPDGPDIAFLRLAAETVGWFEAIGSFYNLLKPRSDASEPRALAELGGRGRRYDRRANEGSAGRTGRRPQKRFRSSLLERHDLGRARGRRLRPHGIRARGISRFQAPWGLPRDQDMS
jgi:hypothetical protein